MLAQLFVCFSSGLLASLIILLAYEFLKSRIIYSKIKKKWPNIKFADQERSWFGNHTSFFRGVNVCKIVKARHEEYGDTVGFVVQDIPGVSTTDLDLIKRIAIDKANVNINRMSVKLSMQEMETDCIFTCENEQWRRIRRAFAPALKPTSFKSPNVVYEVESAVNKLINAIEMKMKDKMCDIINVENLMRRYSLQLVLSCLYKQYDLINFDLSQPCQWVKMVDHGFAEIRDNPFFMLALVVPALRHIIDWLSYWFHPIGQWRRLVLTFIEQQTLIGFKAGKKLAELKRENDGYKVDENNFTLDDGTKFRRNMTDHIVEQFLAGKISKSEHLHSSFFLFGAADITSSDTLVHTLYQLAMNPEIQSKLRASVLAEGTESEYLGWVLNESLRLIPPGPSGCTRTICEPVQLKEGVTLEPGTLVFTNAFTIHRLKKYWGDDADEFRPERWAQAASFHPAQFIPFGAGIRRCPGKEFALFEMRILLNSLIRRYHLECQIKDDLLDFDSPMFILNLQKTPLYVKFTKISLST